MQQADYKFGVCGAGRDEIVNGTNLAIEAWGNRCKEKNSALLGFAYLWRRFGPPWHGTDDYKKLVGYDLTTPDEQVFLTLNLGGCGLYLSIGYLAHESIREEVNKPMVEWCRKYDEWWWKQHPEFMDWEETDENQRKVSKIYWEERGEDETVKKAIAVIGDSPPRLDNKKWQEDSGVVGRVNRALFEALKELDRPVYVRDCAINIFGRCDDSEDAVERSPYAGYGIPQEAMDALISNDVDEKQE